MGVSLSDRGVGRGAVEHSAGEFVPAIEDGVPTVDYMIAGLKSVEFWVMNFVLFWRPAGFL